MDPLTVPCPLALSEEIIQGIFLYSGHVMFGKMKITMESSVWHFSFKSQGLGDLGTSLR